MKQHETDVSHCSNDVSCFFSLSQLHCHHIILCHFSWIIRSSDRLAILQLPHSLSFHQLHAPVILGKRASKRFRSVCQTDNRNLLFQSCSDRAAVKRASHRSANRARCVKLFTSFLKIGEHSRLISADFSRILNMCNNLLTRGLTWIYIGVCLNLCCIFGWWTKKTIDSDSYALDLCLSNFSATTPQNTEYQWHVLYPRLLVEPTSISTKSCKSTTNLVLLSICKSCF